MIYNNIIRIVLFGRADEEAMVVSSAAMSMGPGSPAYLDLHLPSRVSAGGIKVFSSRFFSSLLWKFLSRKWHTFGSRLSSSSIWESIVIVLVAPLSCRNFLLSFSSRLPPKFPGVNFFLGRRP
jgi:hypothetical protein